MAGGPEEALSTKHDERRTVLCVEMCEIGGGRSNVIMDGLRREWGRSMAVDERRFIIGIIDPTFVQFKKLY